jgi:hypothetical protein
MVWIKWTVLVVAALGVCVAALAAYGTWRWAAGTRALFGRLEAAFAPTAPSRYDDRGSCVAHAARPQAILARHDHFVELRVRALSGLEVDGSLSLTMTFSFEPDGTMRGARAEARGRTVAGKVVMTPWEGRWSNVETHDGMRVPTVEGIQSLGSPRGRYQSCC